MARRSVTKIQAARALRGAKRVLLSCHERPDGDALGSCLALAASLGKAGKKALVVNVSRVPGFLEYLPGSKRVRQEPPARGRWDLAVTTDSGNISRLAWDLKGLRESGRVGAILNLDHHKDNDRFGDLNYVDLRASSSGEVAYDLIRAAKLPLDRNVAVNLFTAIVTDTGSFRYSNTTHKTMEIATHLMSYGIRPFQVTEALDMSHPKERVALLGEALSTLEVSRDGRWACLWVPRKVMRKYGDRYELLEGVVDFPRSIASVEVAIFFKEVGPGDWRVSLRSKRFVDVGAIANELGGGGHKFAAGLSVRGSAAQARRELLPRVERALRSQP